MSGQTTDSGRRAMRITAIVMQVIAAAALIWTLYGISQGREVSTAMVVMVPILALMSALLLHRARPKA